MLKQFLVKDLDGDWDELESAVFNAENEEEAKEMFSEIAKKGTYSSYGETHRLEVKEIDLTKKGVFHEYWKWG